MDIRPKTTKDAAGILNFVAPRSRFMVRASRIVRLPEMAMVVDTITQADHIGMILIRVLRSSTSSTLHSFHDFL